MSCKATIAEPALVAPTFREVFEREFGYLMRTLRYLGVRDSELEDVAHDVFLHVYRHLDAYDASRPLRSWLFGFAFRIARDHRARAINRQGISRDLSTIQDSAPTPELLLMRSQLQALALLALRELDDDERAVFVAHELDELTAPEIADALQIPVNTVYSRLRRARSKFETAARSLAARENRS